MAVARFLLLGVSDGRWNSTWHKPLSVRPFGELGNRNRYTIMILVSAESKELETLIRARSVPVERAALLFGDVAFEGNGPDGTMLIGIELKRLHDMLNCIDDARYSAHQRVGMAQMYRVSVLNIEGLWRPHDQKDLMMEGFYNKAGDLKWGYCQPSGRCVMYSKLRRYLFSVALSGVPVTYTRDILHTVKDIVELYWYFQKAWDKHTALLQMQRLNLPALNGKPSLTRRWAANLEDVGVKLSDQAARKFKTPIALATADETEWVKISGIGVSTAQGIWREIHGYSRSR